MSQCHDKENCRSQFSAVTTPALPHAKLERKPEWCINGYSCYGTFIIKVVLDTVLAALTVKFQRYIHSWAVLAADRTDTDSHSDRLGNGEQTALLLNTLFMLPLLTEFSHNVTARMTTTTPACHTRIIFSPASAKGGKGSPLMRWFDTQESCVRWNDAGLLFALQIMTGSAQVIETRQRLPCAGKDKAAGALFLQMGSHGRISSVVNKRKRGGTITRD